MHIEPTIPGLPVRELHPHRQGRIGVTISGVRNTGNVEVMFIGDDYSDFIPAHNLEVITLTEGETP